MKLYLIDIGAAGSCLPPYGLLALKAYLQTSINYRNVEILSFPFDLSPQEIIDRIPYAESDAIGLSCFIWNVQTVDKIVRQLATGITRPIAVFLGGPQVSSGDTSLEQYLIDGAAQALIVGEGELPIRHLIFDLIKLGHIRDRHPGVGTFSFGSIIWGEHQSYPKCNDYLPNPYAVLEEFSHRQLQTVQYESSRGCPYTCSFCDQGHKVFRTLSTERIKADLDVIFKLQPQKLILLDSTFNVSESRTTIILQHIISKNLPVEIHAEIKPERLSREEISLMHTAGVVSVEIGLQSSNPSTLKFIKRSFDLPKIVGAVALLQEVGIEVVINTIIGLPGEQLNDWWSSVDFCFRLGNIRISSNTLKVLPNTAIEEDIRSLDFQIDFSSCNRVVSSDKMSTDDIKRARVFGRLLNLCWNSRADRALLRRVIERYFSNSLVTFLDEILRCLATGCSLDRIGEDGFWQQYAKDTSRLPRKSFVRTAIPLISSHSNDYSGTHAISQKGARTSAEATRI